MKALLCFVYGLACYAVFGIAFVYAVLFLANIALPVTIDFGPARDPLTSALIDLALLAAFAIQHSVMARPAFKAWWTRLVPTAIERSTYVLLASLLLLAICIHWQPLPHLLWRIGNPVARAAVTALSGAGWLIVLVATFSISHFELFGVRQPWIELKGGRYAPVPFTRRFPYDLVRHPLNLGFLIAFWAAPTLSVGHLLFLLTLTAYILAGTLLEERDLVRFHGKEYLDYRREVPMLVPRVTGPLR
jgi:protein-S-isoprenylcysteine O-methyltransferase Ste14